MTPEELKKLDEDLAREENVIENQLSSIAKRNPGVDDDLITKVPNYDDDERDEDDYAHEVADYDRNSAIVRELESRLRDIKKTREKIKGNIYGKCEACSSDINPERLKVMPIASLCMVCAKKK